MLRWKKRTAAGRRPRLERAHHAQFEWMRQQFVLRIQAYAIFQFAADCRAEFKHEALFALLGQRALRFEPVGFRMAVVFVPLLPCNQQFERDVLRPETVEKNAYFEMQPGAAGDALLRGIQTPHRYF